MRLIKVTSAGRKYDRSISALLSSREGERKTGKTDTTPANSQKAIGRV
jgi:hypothetical protein